MVERAGYPFQLKSGLTLTLAPQRNRFAIRKLQSKSAEYLAAFRAGALSPDQKAEIGDHTERMFLYLAGWMVQDDVPPDALDELSVMFPLTESIRVNRARWVRFLLIEDEHEAAAFLSFAMAVATRGVIIPVEEEE